ncbi:hypothetical protein RCO28_23140 [Streptomyces sp. LHD-70]|uniref:hypothetical protein n=1 Tax=Streptomyces sp. LHD-70 TaxID=3072140 RepID=UPI0028104B69|nr:hypothetical protein [Streptomyces sp. LHD-70]MDQ8705368.1 hypothetical protein [Streptomyces sp. LHD-70]
MELAGSAFAFLVAVAPGIKAWLDSVAVRNRAQARVEIIRARRMSKSPGVKPDGPAQEGERR